MHDTMVFDVLRISGKFFAVDGDVIAAGEGSADAVGCQRIDDWLAEYVKINLLHTIRINDKSKIEVAKIMVHCAASGEPADNMDMMLSDIVLIDFQCGILVFADHDRVGVLPKHKI